MRQALAIALFAVLLAGAAYFSSSQPAVVVADSRGVDNPAAEKFHRDYAAALERKFDWHYVDLRIDDFARDLDKLIGLSVRVDVLGLSEVGLSRDTPVSLTAKNLSVRSALENILERHGLTHVPHEGEMLITNPDASRLQFRLVVRTYVVTDLRRPGVDPRGRWRASYEPLRTLLETHVDPPSWTTVGGPCEINEPTPGLFTIGQDLDCHERIEFLLDALRRLDREFAADPLRVTTPWVRVRPAGPTMIALTQRADLEYDGNLAGWVAAMQEAYGINVILNERDLNEVGMSPDSPIRDRVRKASAAEALKRFLTPLGLIYLVRDDYVMITNPDASARPLRQEAAAFPVWDLATAMAPDARDEQMAKLETTICGMVDPSSWQNVGGPGGISRWLKPAALIVAHSDEHIAKTAEALEQIRKARRIQTGG